jgi:hypothetical protein
VVLCWHVDYWDRLGWKDPFGKKQWSERQEQYAKIKKLEVKGTPQFFIDGEVVPWVKGAWQKIPGQVAAGAKAPATFGIDAKAEVRGGTVRVTFDLTKLDAEYEPPESALVHAYLVQKRAVTEVDAGENAGKTLHEPFIVLASARTIPLAKALEEYTDGEQTVKRNKHATASSFALPEGLEAADVTVALLLEDPVTMTTLECWSIPVTKHAPRVPVKQPDTPR